MKVIKLNKVNSTQDYLKKFLESQHGEQDYLVIADEQTSGIGRYGNDWEHVPGSLACSFTFQANKVLPLTSIELAVLIVQYFQAVHDLKIELKWPNDLFYNKKKCGGILIHIHNEKIIVGLGINAKSDQLKDSRKRTGIEAKYLQTCELIEFIHNNRILDTKVLRDEWLNSCIHLNQKVEIGEKKGIFTGIGPGGEAIISNGNSQELVMSGSLRFLLL